MRVRTAVVATALVLAGLAVPGSAAPAVLPVARPTVSAIPAGLHGRPFMGLLAVPKGFVQEEYIVSGVAHPYSDPAILAQRSVPGTDQLPSLPYTTRIVVVRPADPRRSNGAA